ncbi:MAG: HDIG domain-containing protein [Prolixibacteraceae bacterium]|nr:HDIG domain-containing protein [Prolixibacteraceae bacterium]
MVENFKNRLKKYTQIFYWIFIFTLSAVLLFLILPGEPKFKYEYQKGMPWRHDNLVAPFNFSILKTQEELDAEKAEQRKTVIPYFLYDTTIVEKQLAQLEADLSLATDSTNKNKLEAFRSIKETLTGIYQNGILQRSPDSYEELIGNTEIKKRVGSRVSKIEISKIYSEKTAYNEINKAFQDAGNNNQAIKNWLQTISPDKYIEANLVFDKETTDKEIDELTSEILPSRGMVQLGERIVLQGEIVDAEKFQLLESLKASYSMERGEGISRYFISAGKGLLISSLLTLIFTFLYIYRNDVLYQLRKLTFLMLFMCGAVFLASFLNSFPNLHIYLVPLAIFPIIVRTFFDSRTAIFMLIITTILIGFYAPNNYEFILLQVSAGIVAVFSLNRMHRRIHLILATMWVLLTYLVVYTALNLIHEGSNFTFSFEMYKWFIISSVLLLSVYPLIYIFEKIFGFISDVTLIEISDSNQPLLRKLAEEAPGTFQHSMQIANLAEEVILKIGGNPFLVRAGALYHDIGKISKPHFFIENQAAGLNPHDEISYVKSAEIIIDHVQNGVKMAQKHKLPKPLIEFIATHHGTTKANYFFIKHTQEHPDTKIKENSFMYPGPLPRSKEAAVVMLVDGIEAATRSLPEKTYPKLKEVINDMIDNKIKLKQLDQSALTFSDINTIKEILLRKLINIYHVRIEYPKEDKI